MKQAENSPLEVIILAAGKGKRMLSAKPKVLHQIAGKPLLGHVLHSVTELNPAKIHIVLGHGADQVRDWFKDEKGISWSLQKSQRGTADAVATAIPDVHGDSTVLIVYGDIPLIDCKELSRLAESAANGGLALLTAEFENPHGYGRIVRDQTGKVVAIVEQKDADEAQRSIKEINTGFIAARGRDLAGWLKRIDNQNAQEEYYLTDAIGLAVGDGREIHDIKASSPESVLGVNSKVDLALLERSYQQQQAGDFLRLGVSLMDPSRFDARGDVQFGRDCVVDVNVVLEGVVKIGNGVHIGAHTVIKDAVIGDGVNIKSHCVIEEAEIGNRAVVGPFARIRPGTRLDHEVHIGNFVEIKNSRIEQGSKVNHLSYVGDSSVGQTVNIGAGVITANYDGANKHRTQIGDNASIGSNSQLVAPVCVGRGATIGAGSTITNDVPPDVLALSRVRQAHIQGWHRPQKKNRK